MKPRAEGGVLDARLNVYGTQNLKVVDLSLCPDNLGTVRFLQGDVLKEYSSFACRTRIPLPSFAARRGPIFWLKILVNFEFRVTSRGCSPVSPSRLEDQDAACASATCTHTYWKACRSTASWVCLLSLCKNV